MSDDTCDMCAREYEEGEHLNRVASDTDGGYDDDAGDVCDTCYKFLEDEGL